MGQTNTAGLVKFWLENQRKSACIQLRKFYTAKDILLIFKNSPIINHCLNPYVNVEVTSGYVRSFTTILNQIIRENWIPTFKNRFRKETGFEYILLAEADANTNVDSIRRSSRKYKSILSNLTRANERNTTPTVTPSNVPITTPTVTPSNEPITTPTVTPSNEPCATPTSDPTNEPSVIPNTAPVHNNSTLHPSPMQLYPLFHTANQPLPSTSIPLSSASIHPSFGAHSHERERRSSESNKNKQNESETYTKMDQPVALYLFFGRERAKKIIAEETAKNKNESSTFVKIKYGTIVKRHIIAQIKKLQQANLYMDGWKKLLEDEDKSEMCGEYERLQLRNKATYLSMLYHLSLEMYNSTPDFGTVVTTAMEKINSNRLIHYIPDHHQCHNAHIILYSCTLYDWFRTYRDNGCFPNPNANDEMMLPPILNANPDLVDDIMSHCRHNISTLSSECVHQFILTEGIPKLAKTIQKE